MARARARRDCARRWVRVPRPALPLTDPNRQPHNRRALVGAGLFRCQETSAYCYGGGPMSKRRAAQLQHTRGLRCAVYTRKSSEEGLEQEFNSLHAQREACEAFICSQRHEGWACLPQAYDDGGVSGATMDRPALQQLLADIRAGKIDVVVTYKIDRLTRSLADFAKITEIFDERGVSFVSV